MMEKLTKGNTLRRRHSRMSPSKTKKTPRRGASMGDSG